MSVEDERSFESRNKCWICDKLIAVGHSKVRDHDHVTEKFRSSGRWSCDINLKLMQYFIVYKTMTLI